MSKENLGKERAGYKRNGFARQFRSRYPLLWCGTIVFLLVLCGTELYLIVSQSSEYRPPENPRSQESAQSNGLRPRDWTSARLCDVRCRTKVPCVYLDEVDLRIIVLGATRGESLAKCLAHIGALETLGARVAVDIWLDRLRDGTIHQKSHEAALNFTNHWTRGRACVHVQTEHAFIANQWVYSYRPMENTKEIALFVEDDLDLSSLAWRWLKAAHAHYRGTPDVAGFSLEMENLYLRSQKHRKVPLQGPKDQTAIMYPVIACWGYSPIPRVWRQFQDFFHRMREETTVANQTKPYVKGYIHTKWFQKLETEGKQESMAHEMWHIYFTSQKGLLTVYSNLLKYSARRDVLLTTNRQEDGLHFIGMKTDNHKNLMTDWNDSYVNFPPGNSTVRLDIEGRPVTMDRG